jgi:uncharacterized membrane protein
VKLELREIAGDVCVAISEYVKLSKGGLLGQQEPPLFVRRESNDCSDTGNWNSMQLDKHRGFAKYLILIILIILIIVVVIVSGISGLKCSFTLIIDILTYNITIHRFVASKIYSTLLIFIYQLLVNKSSVINLLAAVIINNKFYKI